MTSIEFANYSDDKLEVLSSLRGILKSQNVLDSVKGLMDKNKFLELEVEKYNNLRKKGLKEDIKNNIDIKNGVNLIFYHFEEESIEFIKQIAFELEKEIKEIVFLGTSKISNKPLVFLMISKNIVSKFNLDAKSIINKLALNIDGAGGGQNFLSTAGGKNINGLRKVIIEGKSYFNSILEN